MNKDSGQTSATIPPVESGLVYAHGLAAVVMLFGSLGFGVLASTELLLPDLSGGSAWLGWGLLRYYHTPGVLLGGAANPLFAFFSYEAAVLAGARCTSIAL